MITSSAPQATPKPNKGEVKTTNTDPRSVFLGVVIDMSWQLAIVVLVPIVGGYELDNHFHIDSIGIIVGFVLALCGVFVVMRHMLSDLNQQFFIKPEDKK